MHGGFWPLALLSSADWSNWNESQEQIVLFSSPVFYKGCFIFLMFCFITYTFFSVALLAFACQQSLACWNCVSRKLKTTARTKPQKPVSHRTAWAPWTTNVGLTFMSCVILLDHVTSRYLYLMLLSVASLKCHQENFKIVPTWTTHQRRWWPPLDSLYPLGALLRDDHCTDYPQNSHLLKLAAKVAKQ